MPSSKAKYPPTGGSFSPGTLLGDLLEDSPPKEEGGREGKAAYKCHVHSPSLSGSQSTNQIYPSHIG